MNIIIAGNGRFRRLCLSLIVSQHRARLVNSTINLSFRYAESDYVRALRAHYASRLRLRLDIVVTVILAGIGAYLWRSQELHLLGLALVVLSVGFALMLIAAFTIIPPLAFRREPKFRDLQRRMRALRGEESEADRSPKHSDDLDEALDAVIEEA